MIVISFSDTYSSEPFKRQPYKMVKNTQAIRWLSASAVTSWLLSVFNHFEGLIT